MEQRIKLIVISLLFWGAFMIWYGNTQVLPEQIEFYTGFGLISVLLSGAITLTDYQERKG